VFGYKCNQDIYALNSKRLSVKLSCGSIFRRSLFQIFVMLSR